MSAMTLSEELQWRGLIKDRTFDDITWLDTPRAFYLGSDASADGLTIGNLAVYMLARRLAARGWKTIMLVGGATSLIGDPGGKDEERQLKSYEEIEKNIAAVAAEIQRIFGNFEFTLVNNYDWFKDMRYLEFLRDIGKHYSMTELVQRDYITARMGEGGSGISYAEFSYSLIQGYDYYRIHKDHGVELQIGGSDQWGNLLSGVPLIRKKEGKEVHAFSMPLVINKATGKKFGKSEEGAIWLDPQKTSPFKFYQFWLNADDQGVEEYLKIYTELNKSEVDAVMAEFNENKSGRAAQKKLAQEVTRIVHGTEFTAAAQKATEALFDRTSQQTLNQTELASLKGDLPVVSVAAGAPLTDVLVSSGLASSKSEAGRLIAGGGVSLNWQKYSDTHTGLQSGINLLKVGKNSFALVELT